MLAASADVTPLLSDMMGYDKVKVSRLESVGRDHVKENLETAGKVKKKTNTTHARNPFVMVSCLKTVACLVLLQAKHTVFVVRHIQTRVLEMQPR